MAFHHGQLTVIPGFFALFPAIPIGLWILRRGADRRWTVLALLALIHIDLVIAMTIFPIPIAGQEFDRVTRGMGEDNVIPFTTISAQLTHMSLSNFRQLFGNVVALAPLGIYGPGLWRPLRDWRRFILVAVAFGVGIELAQYAGSLLEGFTYRVTDVDDAMMNATGAVVMFFVWRLAQRHDLLHKWKWLAELREPVPEPTSEPIGR
jgi:glycopeptide antibiotics resistance protein